LANWIGAALILLVFLIDTLMGNMYKIYNSDDYVTQVYQYLCYKEVFNLIPYLLLIIISLNVRIRFDRFDMAILFTCLLLQILNCVDFFVNYNWRPMWSDWVIFAVIVIPSLSMKFFTYEKSIS
jgi:hypothetical protein